MADAEEGCKGAEGTRSFAGKTGEMGQTRCGLQGLDGGGDVSGARGRGGVVDARWGTAGAFGRLIPSFPHIVCTSFHTPTAFIVSWQGRKLYLSCMLQLYRKDL